MNKLTFHFNLGLSIVILSLFFSCTQDNGNKKKTKSYLPVARGADGVILVVMDSALWADSLGKNLRQLYPRITSRRAIFYHPSD